MSDVRSPETEYYRSANVLITNALAEISGRTFAMGNISAVSMSSSKSSLFDGCTPYVAMAVVGVICLTIVEVVAEVSGSTTFALAVAVAVAVAFIVLALKAESSIPVQFHVNLTSTSGEYRVFSSRNREEIEEIVAAVKQAIIDRA